jgi:ketosteroid isomerase-like protein
MVAWEIRNFGRATARTSKVEDMNEESTNELLKIEQDFQQAILENNAEAIERFVSDDWIIVNSDGKIVDKDRFLAVVKSGALTHHTMQLDEPRVRVHGDTGVVTGRARSAGKFIGAEFTTLELATDVFVKMAGQWRCILTHLTRIAGGDTT